MKVNWLGFCGIEGGNKFLGTSICVMANAEPYALCLL